MKGIKATIRLSCAAGLGCLPLAAAAHLLNGSPDPLPRWVPIAGLAIVGAMGGLVGFAVNKHRQSMERLKKQRQQRAAEAAAGASGHAGAEAASAPEPGNSTPGTGSQR